MEAFIEYLNTIKDENHKERLQEILVHLASKYPSLMPKIAYNQPVFTDHGTYIIGFGVAKHHISVAPEIACMQHFTQQIAEAGYASTKGLFKIGWDNPINYSLLDQLMEFNMQEKASCTTFWRK
jgi:uncharacterized protein